VHEIKEGDIVLYPSKRDRKIHIGHIKGLYKYKPSVDAAYPNQREVNWTKFVPRTYFTQGALYEIGSALSLFQVSRYADEFLAAMRGESIAAPPSTDETVSLVAGEVEENTKDFLLKQLAQELKGHDFTHFVAHLLNKMGYRTRVSPEGPDGGIDIVAHKDELGLEPPIIKVQVKSGAGNIRGPDLKSFYANVDNSEVGLYVTLGGYTKQAIQFGEGKANLRLIGDQKLVDLILEHYEEFDPRYKRLIPLRRVYIPESLEESEE
jgi:restriction system protein